MNPVVQVRDLHYTFEDGTQALRGIDFELAPASTVALLGPNGSGKTTFVLHLNGLLKPTRGTVSIDGVELAEKHLPSVRRKVGLVFQDSDNQLFMPTVLEDVAFGPLTAGLSPHAAREKALEALRQVQMDHKAGKAPW